MSANEYQMTKEVTVEVPPEVANQACERASEEDEFETMLLDYVLFEYEWKVETR